MRVSCHHSLQRHRARLHLLDVKPQFEFALKSPIRKLLVFSRPLRHLGAHGLACGDVFEIAAQPFGDACRQLGVTVGVG